MRRRELGETEKRNKKRPTAKIGRRILAFLRRWKDLDRAPGNVVGLSKHQLNRAFRAACEQSGLLDVTPHTLRHTRATWLMQAGIPLHEIAGHLGMTVRTLEEVYGHHHPDYQRNAADA